MKIYLASASPRRRELLEQIGLEFEVKVSNVQERVTASEPGRVVEELSAQKAEAVLEELIREETPGLPGHGRETAGKSADRSEQEGETAGKSADLPENGRETAGKSADRSEQEREPAGELLVIGADTVVELDGTILGKPSGPEQAAEMLERLAGRTHRVYTGVTLFYRTGEGETLRKTFHEVTRVSFYPMSEKDITRYLNTGDCMDKAGAYGIQGFCARYIQGIEGDYNNVVGLPVGRLYQEAKEWLGE